MATDKKAALAIFEHNLSGAIIALQNVELAILEAGEGRISADFLKLERLETQLVGVQQSLERYRAALPHAHSWYKEGRRS